MPWPRLESRLFVLATALFCVALVVKTEWLNRLLFWLINGIGWLIPEPILLATTLAGDSAAHVTIIAWIAVYRRQILLPALIFSLISLPLTPLLKDWFDTVRPAFALGSENIRIVGPILLKGAFPSGHSISTAGLAVLCAHYLGQRGWIVPLASLVILSRVFVGAHWPADVMAGSAVGILLALIALKLANMWQPKRWMYLVMHWLFIAFSWSLTTVYHGSTDQWLAQTLLVVALASWLLRCLGIDWRVSISASDMQARDSRRYPVEPPA